MESNYKLLWDSVLTEVKTEVSTANFLTLFKNTFIVSIEGDAVTIAVPSTMIIDLIQKRFHSTIKKALDRNLKNDSKIIFIPKSAEVKNSHSETALFFETPKTQPVGHLPRVRADYIFETFAVSSGNQLAYVSAKTVAKKIGAAYNPLFMYGPVGVGKTHLMQAIANEVYLKDPTKKVIYITSEEFTNEVVEAIRTNDTGRMKKKFRNVDLFLMDDIQFIAGKEKVQEELFHTFNILIDKGSQIALSSDRPPDELQKIEKRLVSRFAGGLTVDIEPADFELRAAILLIKAKKYGYDLSIDVAKIIAEKTQDARSLEGTLLRLITESQTKEVEITPQLATSIIKGERNDSPSLLHAEDIIKNTCDFYGLKTTALKGPKRTASLVKARQVCMYLLKKELGLTYLEIGNLLGGRDHTTIMHGVSKIETLVSKESLPDISGIIKVKN